MQKNDFAKFFSGVAANQVLTHGAMAAGDVQFTLFGIAYTQEFNAIAAAIWAVIASVLVYYAWLRPAARTTLAQG